MRKPLQSQETVIDELSKMLAEFESQKKDLDSYAAKLSLLYNEGIIDEHGVPLNREDSHKSFHQKEHSDEDNRLG